MPSVVRGWDSWAGDGVDETKYQQKVKQLQKVKQQKIEELRKKRSDHKLKGVVLNTEERDKKFAHKYWLKELPHPYENVQQFKKAMEQPIGREWNTIQAHKRIIQPEVLTKAGEIIKPLQFKKEFNPQTIESLVAHRQKKKQSRPAAKF